MADERAPENNEEKKRNEEYLELVEQEVANASFHLVKDFRALLPVFRTLALTIVNDIEECKERCYIPKFDQDSQHLDVRFWLKVLISDWMPVVVQENDEIIRPQIIKFSTFIDNYHRGTHQNQFAQNPINVPLFLDRIRSLMPENGTEIEIIDQFRASLEHDYQILGCLHEQLLRRNINLTEQQHIRLDNCVGKCENILRYPGICDERCPNCHNSSHQCAAEIRTVHERGKIYNCNIAINCHVCGRNFCYYYQNCRFGDGCLRCHYNC